jgi:hypothetical protein
MSAARMGYRAAVMWIALNDNSGNGDTVGEIAGYITVALVADLAGKTMDAVAEDVMRARVRELGEAAKVPQ